ncbi:asparagine synthase (glutamine-hydrolyzing) [Paenibacillus mucilaginosus]|uniref:asparagine synthase (glutamine-hydrolyzing) n=3 Tax=Paenibacillus mucilaginosus TaxID=61624 RepID=H6NR54_9BACL|nr:asparagine synthase (glutamine-hydrolyzing) [Paenibacillus mucilaginosus]AEI45014.1 AsnO [Paenibacillus mucilaginosus KNP414]AFC32747.1 AsnO [Paenibacillus mucilaginosus 3016]AFH65082.1 asparagine synthase [Paenibacillus mucilaginosus K02]MCG7213081.1 asparagine synthase (glutamine-hydrolyzing) [Paenibacillus mucilaginosus]WDM26514.1 asparagine synthase (glutamine-hydrolyzing) [Paenibacillus mucilaginosus]
MCGITGWIDWNKDLTQHPSVLENMTDTLAPRGPDAAGTWIVPRCALGHRRLSVMDPANGAQPMTRKVGENTFAVVYNGELYNAPELKKELEERGHRFRTTCDTEVLLAAYVEWGPGCVDRFNGIFAFAAWNNEEQSLFAARDRLGVKPFFYAYTEGRLLFGSEPKAILAHPDFPAQINGEGLAEIFAVGPARTPGHGVYKNLTELKPGHCLTLDANGLRIRAYWKLESRPHEDDVEATAAKVQELLRDTVIRQLASDVPVCTLLSGGLDSSALTSLAASYYKDQGLGTLHTFSVDYVDNDKHFKANAFQPNADAPWIQRMTDHLGTVHHPIEFDTPELVEALRQVVSARDLPGMADVDGSLYLFCREIKKHATVAISGEAADEIFGGYPWFHREEALNADTFPWSLATPDRVNLLSKDFVDWVKPEQYVKERYRQALSEVPRLAGENQQQNRMREMSYLNITRFMPTLLDRKDRMSMAVGLEVRVPFCDHRLVEYVWNIPWEIKTSGDREKGILRKALRGVLPEDVLTRKKSPYPKTHNPNYLAAVRSWVLEILDDSSSPLLQFIDVAKIRALAEDDGGKFDLPWFGQLMTGPQLFAYLAQVDTWLRQYKVAIR